MRYEQLIDELGPERLRTMYRKMLEIRTLEEKVRFLFLEGKMPGTIHQYVGMEACAVGVCSALEESDVIASTHRPNGHALAKGLSLVSILAELYGKTTGCCKGKGGAMHLGDASKGMLPAVAVVAANMPIVAGAALAFKLKGEKHVAVSFFGDGASNNGAFHEALNLASVLELPAVFVCENNHYAASTSIKRTLKIQNIANRAAAYGLPGVVGDGMDVLEVYTKTRDAVARARRGGGATLLELKTFRYCGHSRQDPNNYMDPQEVEFWKKKDPIPAFGRLLLEAGMLDQKALEAMASDVEAAVDEAISQAQADPLPQQEATFSDLYVTMEVPQ